MIVFIEIQLFTGYFMVVYPYPFEVNLLCNGIRIKP